jgi:hypothetical protein
MRVTSSLTMGRPVAVLGARALTTPRSVPRPTPSRVSILDAMRDPKLFGPSFPMSSWRAWQSFLAAMFALPMPPALQAIYQAHTRRVEPPTTPAREAWAICGRRAGKSRIAALVAVYLACFKDHTPVLAPGEVGTLMVLAADRKQAPTILRYIRGLLDAVPILKQGIVNQTAESITLSRRVIIEVVTASFRSTRGYTVIACVADELAFWRSEESANPDTEILAAIRPAMATTKGVLLCISSPYARKGALWQAYRDHFAKDGSGVLVWQAPSRAMNPEIEEATVARALADDPAAARAEWGGEFRADIETFVSIETLTALVSPGVTERPPMTGVSYYAFVDPAGGSGADSMTLAVAHADKDTGHVILDLVAEVRPPFSPESVATDFAAILTRYAIRAVTGDKYGGVTRHEKAREFGPAAPQLSGLGRGGLRLASATRRL